MKIDGDWAVGGLARYAPDLDYGVAPPPLPDDRSGSSIVTWSGGWSLAIPRGARNVEGAWRWITFSTSPEAKRIEWAAQAE
ncbi:extracellular solute-binding protein, partial [Acinetobacter baumannii]